MGLLRTDLCPEDLRRLDAAELAELAAEIRSFLVESVCRHGGHLGPNLGVVEVTIAMHRVFDSPRTPLVFDTGHQAYVHKLLTGRAAGFSQLRAAGGLSGYPNRAESEHDLVENSHASTALSYADGLSKAFELAGQDRPVVVLVGDGALTGGLAWEALNNLGTGGRRVVVVLNDNGRSYSPTVGGLPRHLARLCDRGAYGGLQQLLGGGSAPAPVHPEPANLFGELGFGYVGPVDGHDVAAVEAALRRAAAATGPVVVHCRTQKGRGYPPAETDPADRLHTVGVVDPATGRAAGAAPRTWTDAFGATLVELAESHPKLVAVTAAMRGPTGLQPFADAYPARCFDVGIAEQHAVTSAAGLALGGAHPVVALYATFANRAFDQALLDVGLHRLPVTFVLDRAGITGPDGPSHHGMWDLAVFGAVPGLAVAAPRDPQTLAGELAEALELPSPTMLRFPKSSLGPTVPAVERWGRLDVLQVGARRNVLLVCVGPTAVPALAAAERLTASGVDSTVVDPRWVLPVDPELVGLADDYSLVVTVEDGVRAGGVGSRLAQSIADSGSAVGVVNLGLPSEFVAHGGRAELLGRHGLDADGICFAVQAALHARRSRRLDHAVPVNPRGPVAAAGRGR
ncbi:MAG TPA: 1-deoxy-D-xylulose-5-phosphate synthase [Nocardioidaceae bacterium]|nr:1-deoxy-D-xylulose-5-phosphate synthase [Nocardioidaceae bacterium]